MKEMTNMKLKAFLGGVLAFGGLSISDLQAASDYYYVKLQETSTNNFQLVGYSFNTNTISQALAGDLEHVVSVLVWNVAGQCLEENCYDTSWGWDDPDMTLMPGTAFYVKYYTDSGSNAWLIVQGTQLGDTNYPMALQAGKIYFLASAYKIALENTGNRLECLSAGAYHVDFSLLYPGSPNDEVKQLAWDEDGNSGWETNTREWDTGLGVYVWNPNIPRGLSPLIRQSAFWDFYEWHDENYNLLDADHKLPAYGGGLILSNAVAKTWYHLHPQGNHECQYE